MRTYMCLEAHEMKNTNLVTQHLLKCCVYIFLLLLLLFWGTTSCIFLRSVFRKLRVKFEICTNLGSVCSFFVGDLKFIRVSNWVVQRFGISVQIG
jgi:hypothetical protein